MKKRYCEHCFIGGEIGEWIHLAWSARIMETGHRRDPAASAASARVFPANSLYLSWPFSLALWPQTIFCLKSHPTRLHCEQPLGQEKINYFESAISCKNYKNNFTVEVNFLVEGRKIRKMGDYRIFIEVFPMAGATCLSSIWKASGSFCVSPNIHWILLSISQGVFEMWERKRLTDL